ncbi:hypothetical protein BRADI_5g19770v3 [Brachypodium distachyon]|uniref:F-box domain-containing protein n=1 Tax=Brachypodium distachyon TaxID=15368 RepID=A0A2K2CI63_BRADI|nr:hypothetical protein BRADI_5g19770v3 [Brachypodium distachyon]
MALEYTSRASKRRITALCSEANLPEEIMSEILLLLPARSVLRCRAVCRSWAALLCSRGFLDAYAVKADTRSRRMDKFVLFAPSAALPNRSTAVYSFARGAVGAPLFTVDRVRADFLCLSSRPCHGVMLFSDTRSGTYWVCNPSTGERSPLPKQHRGLTESSAGLVYEDRTKECKVVHLFKDARMIGMDMQAEPAGRDALLCFSVATETFTLLNAPASVLVAEYRELDDSFPAVPVHLAELEGYLCLVHDLRRRGQGRNCWLDVWMLRDHGASEWSLDYRIALHTHDVHIPRFITVLGCCSGVGQEGNFRETRKKLLIASSQHQVHTYDPDTGDVQLVVSVPDTDIRIGQKEAPAALWFGLYEDSLVRIGSESHQEKQELSALTEILVRLPVKSIAQSMLVCRRWCSLIESESFVAAHMSVKRPKRILMANNGRARRALFDFAPVKNWLQAAGPAIAKDKIICSKPCNGLSLISTGNDDFLCNVCTGAIQCLGRRGKSHFSPTGNHRRHAFSVGRNIGFGFDRSTGEHVAAEIGHISGTLACMIKTSSEKQWSCVGKPPRPVSDMPPAHVDGTIYWMSKPMHEEARAVVAFEISTRAFRVLPCEPCLNNDHDDAFVVELTAGTLSVVVVNAEAEEMDIWVMHKHSSSWVYAYKIQLGQHADYSLRRGQVVVPMDEEDGNDGRILLNTGRALGYYDTKTGALDHLYSLDKLKLPRSNLAFPILCQESLIRIQDDELPSRVAHPVRDQGCKRCDHPEHADASPAGRGRALLLPCEGGACRDIGVVYRSCCRRLFCGACQRRCLEHSQTHALRGDPVLPAYGFDATMVSPDSVLPFCHPSVPGPEYCYYNSIEDGDVVRHVFISLKDYMRGEQSCRWTECGYRMEGQVVKEIWVRRYLKL